ncbi:7820_t:CDS:1 [Funneliformis geosporum]|uniref:3106_t:CDS:1 n=1 Tax=Funneliformis geosporum TaxID=1117311 RepID=A0A9W4SPT4_9GLOM|nr:7820_t:CDS:1 [Funneliformis geosporum]CAI2178270.1 3106_t:CDS:1 [Funneliformis geosporum]
MESSQQNHKYQLRSGTDRWNKLEEKYPGIFKYKKDSREEVFEYLKDQNDNDNKSVIYINSESLTVRKLYDLCDKEIWLSSDHINAYLSYLNKKFPSIFSLPSFFYTKLTETGKYEYSSVIRWTKRIDIFKKELIFIPINLDESHWILAAIFMKVPRRIAVLDSLGILMNRSAVSIGKNLIKWLNDEYRNKVQSVDNDDEYEDFEINDKDPFRLGKANDDDKNFLLDIVFLNRKPPQSDGCSCGVFVCMFARLMAEDINRDIIIEIAKSKEANMKFRKVMCTELWDYAKERAQHDDSYIEGIAAYNVHFND